MDSTGARSGLLDVGEPPPLTNRRHHEIQRGIGPPPTEEESRAAAAAAAEPSREMFNSPAVSASLARFSETVREFKQHYGFDPSDAPARLLDLTPAQANVLARRRLARPSVGRPHNREHHTRASRSASASGSSRDPDRPRSPEPRLGRRFEVDELTGRSRPMNGHHEWDGSRVYREIVSGEEPLARRLLRSAILTLEIERELARRFELERATCTRCGHVVGRENMSPGRAWCRPCEAKRRKQAPSRQKAAK